MPITLPDLPIGPCHHAMNEGSSTRTNSCGIEGFTCQRCSFSWCDHHTQLVENSSPTLSDCYAGLVNMLHSFIHFLENLYLPLNIHLQLSSVYSKRIPKNFSNPLLQVCFALDPKYRLLDIKRSSLVSVKSSLIEYLESLYSRTKMGNGF